MQAVRWGAGRGEGWTHLEVDVQARTGRKIDTVAASDAPATRQGNMTTCEARVHTLALAPRSCITRAVCNAVCKVRVGLRVPAHAASAQRGHEGDDVR